MRLSDADELIKAADKLGDHAWLERFRKAGYDNNYADISPHVARDIAGCIDAFIADVKRLVSDRETNDECEHGTQCGDWCEICNKEYKQAIREEDTDHATE